MGVVAGDGTGAGAAVTLWPRVGFPSEPLDAEERRRLAPYVTDLDGPVFALVNLPEATKGAAFARYSRSPKGLRRLLLDEFLTDGPAPDAVAPGAGQARAGALYERVLAEYGDDSVAQLGGAHIAVEGVSNVLTKIIEWGRLAAYLEQSTRYVDLSARVGGAFRYARPPGVMADPSLAPAYELALDGAFAAYGRMVAALTTHLEGAVPVDPEVPAPARARALRARALDGARGLLPAATVANVGVFATGQAYEAMLVRLLAHPLDEARACGELMLGELRKVIPEFLTRVDRPDRGGAHGAYMRRGRDAARRLAEGLALDERPAGPDGPAVRLLDFDPDGESRVLAHALWAECGRSLADVRARVDGLSAHERAEALAAITGARSDRRQRPGRAFEATTYVFEVVADYGAYRDLQRHRMLSLQAQSLTPVLGYDMPELVAEAGHADAFAAAQRASAALHDEIAAGVPDEAPYAVSLAHRVRFTMIMSAREAMHVIELRSQPQGHDAYRAVAQEMHRCIREVAGHPAIAAAMTFVDHSRPAAGRMDAERRTAAHGGGRPPRW